MNMNNIFDKEKFKRLLPQSVYSLNQIFKLENFQFILVGGCIRNFILNYPIKDFDICTDATPEEMIELAKKYKLNFFDSGSKFGTISFVLPKDNVSTNLVLEVTTFRSESEYTDNRYPNKIEFTKSFKEDTKRRDLTINALGFNIIEDKLIDYHNGLQDIQSNIIRCIGSPDDRFQEDALRILRVVRFSCQLAFTIDKEVYKSILLNAKLLRNISKERIRDEFIKILKSKYTDYGLALMKQTGIIYYTFNMLTVLFDCNQNTPYHNYDVWHHTLLSIKNIGNFNWKLKLVMLLHDIGKPDCRTINDYGYHNFIDHSNASVKIAELFLKSLKFDKDTINYMLILIEHHDDELKITKKHIKKKINQLGNYLLLFDLIKVQLADKQAQNGLPSKQLLILKSFEFNSLIEEVIKSGEPIFLKDLVINGNDIKEFNSSIEGKQIGIVLNRLLSHVIAVPEDNFKEKLLTLVNGVNK